MNENKKILSVQVDKEIIEMLKEICKLEKRSQAKTLEVLIISDLKRLKIR